MSFSYGLGLEPNKNVLRHAANSKPIYAIIKNEFNEQACERLLFGDYTTPARPDESFYAMLAAEVAIRRARKNGLRGDQFVVTFSMMVMATRVTANDGD